MEYTPDELGTLMPTAVLQYGPLTSDTLRRLSIRELESGTGSHVRPWSAALG